MPRRGPSAAPGCGRVAPDQPYDLVAVGRQPDRERRAQKARRAGNHFTARATFLGALALLRPAARAPWLRPELGAEVAFLQPCLEHAEEAGGVGAVDQPVVVGHDRYIMSRTAITSPSLGSLITTGRLTSAPVPRMATCGWLMIGVSIRVPGGAVVGDRERAAAELVRASPCCAGSGRRGRRSSWPARRCSGRRRP